MNKNHIQIWKVLLFGSFCQGREDGSRIDQKVFQLSKDDRMKRKICLQLKKHFKTDHLQQRDPKIEAQVATDATLFGKIVMSANDLGNEKILFVFCKSCSYTEILFFITFHSPNNPIFARILGHDRTIFLAQNDTWRS